MLVESQDFFGMGTLPDDAEWVTIRYTNRDSAKTVEMVRPRGYTTQEDRMQVVDKLGYGV